MIAQRAPPLNFVASSLEATKNVFFLVTAPTQTLFEQGHGGRRQENDDGERVVATYLQRTFDLNLEEYVAILGRVWSRGSVEISVEFGPLEEEILRHRFLKNCARDEFVLLAALTWAPVTCGPGTTEPQPGIQFEETTRNSPFADSSRTNQDNEQRLSAPGREIAVLADVDRVRGFSGSGQLRHSS